MNKKIKIIKREFVGEVVWDTIIQQIISIIDNPNMVKNWTSPNICMQETDGNGGGIDGTQ